MADPINSRELCGRVDVTPAGVDQLRVGECASIACLSGPRANARRKNSKKLTIEFKLFKYEFGGSIVTR
jgi:hypothetical protein